MALMVAKVLFFLVLVVHLLGNHGGEGSNRRILSKEEQEDEDLELKRQLKILNKPPIKTFYMDSDDIFDCIDINKQPAFDHPLLQNHKIQMRPSSYPAHFAKKRASSSNETAYSKSRRSVMKHLDCPQGTIPIRRTTKEDLIRAKSFFESHTSSIHPQDVGVSGQHLAVRRTSDDAKETYFGVFGLVNIANPLVEGDQFLSTGQVWVEGGSGIKGNNLQAGWAVSQVLFGDNKTRLFVNSNWDVTHHSGCYNLLCKGFIQISQNTPIGSELTPISEYDGNQYDLTVSIFQDKDTTHWWLNFDKEERETLGYWPNDIFSELVKGASRVGWGGSVRGQTYGPSPQMGNGKFPAGRYDEACSVTKLQVVYSNYSFEDLHEAAFQDYVDSSNCFKVEYSGFVENQGYSFLFGGPGGSSCEN